VAATKKLVDTIVVKQTSFFSHVSRLKVTLEMIMKMRLGMIVDARKKQQVVFEWVLLDATQLLLLSED
jgi:ribosomal silencing factor RsfS